MKIMRIPALALLFAACLSACCGAATLKETKDIVFATAGKIVLKADLYAPESKTPLPGVVYIHGGGFVAGTKDFPGQVSVARMLANAGFVVFSVNYRLVQEGGVLPNSLHDVKAALCFFRAHSKEYGFDPERVGALGESAGGTLALLLAYTSGIPDFAARGDAAKDCDDRVSPVVGVFPATNFSTLNTNLTRMLKNEMIRAFGKEARADLPKFMARLSPESYADRAVPTLLIHGVNDMLVPVEQSRSLDKTLKSLKKESEYIELTDAPHGFFSELFDKPQYDPTRKRAVDFLKERLKK